MSKLVSSPVTALLERHGVVFEVIEIPLSPDRKPIRALEQIMGEHGYPPGSVVRSILFRTDAQKYVLLAIAGSTKADWGTLRKHLGESRLTLAEPSEVSQQTGYVIGSVPPLALPETIRVLADESLERYEKLIVGSGVLGYALGLGAADLRNLMEAAEFGHFGKASE